MSCIEDLRGKARKLAYDNAVGVWHKESKSHIIFAPWTAPFGAKGIGNFADQAFKNYLNCVDEMIAKATERDLNTWIDLYYLWAAAGSEKNV